MSLLSDLRLQARHAIGPALAAAAIGYFAYHVVHGDRGLIAWRARTAEVASAKAELGKLTAEREAIEHRTKLLYPNSLDPDMLDEWSRRVLNYGLPDEIVILTDSQPPAAPKAGPAADAPRAPAAPARPLPVSTDIRHR